LVAVAFVRVALPVTWRVERMVSPVRVIFPRVAFWAYKFVVVAEEVVASLAVKF
jgi:hypothetical protein